MTKAAAALMTLCLACVADFEDDFAIDTMGEWEVVDVGTNAAPSKWSIADGALHQTSNIYTTPFDDRCEADWTGTFLVSRGGQVRDGVVDTTFWSTDDDGIGLVWRYRDRGNYCKVQIDSSGRFWQISKTVDGAFTCLGVGGDRSYTKGRRHRLEVRIEDETIAMGAEYIPLLGWHECLPAACAKLRSHGIIINYCCTSDPGMFQRLIEAGVQYPLADDLDAAIVVLKRRGCAPG